MDIDLILAEIVGERHQQNQKWGEQNHDPEVWLAILGEEFGEACKSILESRAMLGKFKNPTEKLLEYRKELIQIAAVAVAAVQCLERNSE